jgi:heptosyltransferase-1
MAVSSSKRVLIIRLSAIGDVVFASPLVEACKRRYPDAEIDWLAEGVVRPLIVGMPSVGRVILWPRQEWRALWEEKRLIALFKAVRGFRRELQARNYDLVVDAQGLLKSAFLAWLTGCRDRIGFTSKEPNGLFLSKRYPKQITSRISSEYLGLAQELGWNTEQFELVLGLTDEDHVRASNVADPGSYIAITPFTTRPQKHWTPEHWRSLVQSLGENGHTVGCLGGPADRDEAAKMLEGLTVENWVGTHPLGVSASLVSKAKAVIGVDTGLTHMGIAAGVPTVALFGSTCPYTETGRDNVRVIYHGLDCAPCKRRPTCGGAFTCMTELLPAEVVEALGQVLSGESTTSNIE